MADVASTLQSWSITESSNSPSGATVIGSGLDDNLRQIQATVRSGLAYYNATPVASASTVDLNAATGNFLDISGTTTITAFGTASAGIWKVLRFTGALTLTHNGTSLILPGAANITTANGDVCLMYSLGSGNWKCAWYQRADAGATAGTFRIVDSSDITKKIKFDASGITTGNTRTYTFPDADTTLLSTSAMAVQATMEAASSTTTVVNPGVVKYHPGVAKAWAQVNFSGGTPSVVGSSGSVTITDSGTGITTVNLPVTFSSTGNMGVVATLKGTVGYVFISSATTSTVVVNTLNTSAVATDLDFYVAVFGDL